MAKKYFEQVDQKVNFPSLEEGILSYWDEKDVFKKSIKKNEGKTPFVFYEGPPTANGKPGIHHVESRSFKDIIPRYKTMRGYYCDRKAGWDCHGLPVELEVEKKLGISGKPQIEEHGIKEFNELCKTSVYEYVDEWTKVTKRIGYWTDLDNPYETMDNGFIESGWYILKTLWDKDLMYEDYKVVPYCARCGTSLSSHELALGYKDDVEDPSVFVKFKLKDKDNTYFLAWTTTPWTLPGNVGLAVDPKESYVEIETGSGNLILAEKRLEAVAAEGKVVKKYTGSELEGMDYEPLYNFIAYDKKAHYVIGADFVSMEDGTGIVHTAVMYGEEDFNLGKKHNLPTKHLVNERGEFIEEVPWHGKFVKNTDKDIIAELTERGLMFRSEKIKHTYPFCWRCGTPLLYYALTSWYLKTTAVKKDLIKNNESVNWYPSHIKQGRMGEWLGNNRDWALSRSRYWGTPLPVWKCNEKDCLHVQVVGSVAELSKFAGKDLKDLDLHRPFVDDINFKCSQCKTGTMFRVPFVLDCWFDSGAMPYSQWHYPFENEDKFKQNFPADYIAEAIDQTRGWFYTLQAVSALLGNGTAYKNVICLGHVLDEQGNKMSKSKGNVVNPWEVLGEVGADATRWYFFSVISPGPSFRFSANLVKDVLKRFMLILWNSYNFFVTYSNLVDWEPTKTVDEKDLRTIDKWILVRLQETVNKVTNSMDNYDLFAATHEIEDFVSKDFSQWYIRRSRKEVGDAFFSTAWTVLTTVAKLMAPFAPFVSEEIYKNLTKEESVHLADWPQTKELSKQENEMLFAMEEVRQVVEKAHSLRKEAAIPTRQPLSKMTVKNAKYNLDNYLNIFFNELNIKDGDIEIGNGELSVELDTTITPELKSEGEARDIVRSIQEERKSLGTKLDELVSVTLPAWPMQHEDYIKKNALVSSIQEGEFKVSRQD